MQAGSPSGHSATRTVQREGLYMGKSSPQESREALYAGWSSPQDSQSPAHGPSPSAGSADIGMVSKAKVPRFISSGTPDRSTDRCRACIHEWMDAWRS